MHKKIIVELDEATYVYIFLVCDMFYMWLIGRVSVGSDALGGLFIVYVLFCNNPIWIDSYFYTHCSYPVETAWPTMLTSCLGISSFRGRTHYITTCIIWCRATVSLQWEERVIIYRPLRLPHTRSIHSARTGWIPMAPMTSLLLLKRVKRNQRFQTGSHLHTIPLYNC